jgi:hypothetical protein
VTLSLSYDTTLTHVSLKAASRYLIHCALSFPFPGFPPLSSLSLPDLTGHQWSHACLCPPPACLPTLSGVNTFTIIDTRPFTTVTYFSLPPPASGLKQCTFLCSFIICKSPSAHHVSIITNTYPPIALASYNSLFILHSLVPPSETSVQHLPRQPPPPLHCMFSYFFISCKFLRRYIDSDLAMANGMTMFQLQRLQDVPPGSHRIDSTRWCHHAVYPSSLSFHIYVW